MTGGILDLVAKGFEDIYLTKDPNITFFKTVYRRYTNFSRDEVDLNFNNKIDFGKEGFCVIEKFGDLLHRLFLIIKLPIIDVRYKTLFVGDVVNLLKTYDIIWDTVKDINDYFDINDFTIVKKIISDHIFKINNNIIIIDDILRTLEHNGKFYPLIWRQNHPFIDDNISENDYISNASEKYSKDILKDFLKLDKYYLQFIIIHSHAKDTMENQLPLANSQFTHNLILKKLVKTATSSHDFSVLTYNNMNINFLYNVEMINNFMEGNSDSIFRSAITSVYEQKKYTHLDSYKIFDNMLAKNNLIIQNSSSMQNFKKMITENIKYGLVKNIKLMKNIFNSLTDDTRFIFYKKYILSSLKLTNYDNSTEFISDSQDNFTNNFAIKQNEYNILDENNLFLKFLKSSVYDFHNKNKNLFKNIKLNPYFNDLSLWAKTNILDFNFSSSLNIAAPQNINFMNYVWLLMNQDIKASIIKYLSVNLFQDVGLLNKFDLFLQNISNNIATIINPKIINNLNYLIAASIDSSNKINNDIKGDVISLVIIRPGTQYSVINSEEFGNVTIPEFIQKTYISSVNDFCLTLLNNDELKNYKSMIPTINNIINLFMTDIDTLPDYNTYLRQDYNINKNLKINNIDKSVNEKIIFSDAISSIWNFIFLKFVNNYNDLYNHNLLGLERYKDKLGSEMSEYLKDILTKFFNYNINKDTEYDYFRQSNNKKTEDSQINIYLDNKILLLQEQLNKYDNNINDIYKLKNIVISKNKLHYNEFNKTTNFIMDSFNKDNLLSIKEDINNYSVQHVEPRNNVADIILNIKKITKLFFQSGISNNENEFILNPFDENTQFFKFKLWEQYRGKFCKEEEEVKFNLLFKWLYEGNINKELFKYDSQIDALYNGFITENDVYNFMKDFIVQNSLFKNLPSLIGPRVNNTYVNILNYYLNLKKYYCDLISRINGEGNHTNILTILRRSLDGGTDARFAWIRRLGHYLIDQMWIKFDDQIIDKQYGEWLEIWHSLTKIKKKEKGYNTLIGDIPSLTLFNNKIKNSHQIIIPLQFWFCKHIGSSLPLVALNNTEIKIYFKMKKLEDVCFRDNFTTFRRKPRLKCKLMAEYIYVEEEERTRLAKSKLEYLIDVLQYNGDLLISKDNFKDNYGIETTTFFRNPCKEIIWTLQPNFHIDGSYAFCEKLWNIYSYDKNGIINPIDKAKIKFNGRTRESFKDIEFYNLIQPWERHNSSPDIGINLYCFSLNPESNQPSGAVNLSKIDNLTIKIIIKKEIINDMVQHNIVFRMPIYAITINILRIMSGLSGLVYPQ